MFICTGHSRHDVLSAFLFFIDKKMTAGTEWVGLDFRRDCAARQSSSVLSDYFKSFDEQPACTRKTSRSSDQLHLQVNSLSFIKIASAPVCTLDKGRTCAMTVILASGICIWESLAVSKQCRGAGWKSRDEFFSPSFSFFIPPVLRGVRPGPQNKIKHSPGLCEYISQLYLFIFQRVLTGS